MNDVDPKKLQQRLDEIAVLSKKKADIERELAILTGVLVEKSPAPVGFDYKSKVLEVFVANPNSVFSIDEVTQAISHEAKFTADRQAVSNRLNYLTDREGKLQRVEGRRGIYQLATDVEDEPTTEAIESAADLHIQQETDRQRGKL